MGRKKATKCRLCGSTELYIGALCHECHKKHRLTVPNYKSWLKEVNDQADVKRREFIESGNFGDFEYVGGFTSGKCNIVLRCKACGSERKMMIDAARSHNESLKCRKCHPKGGHRPWNEWVECQRKRGSEQKALTEELKKKEYLDKIRIVKCAICGNEFQTIQLNQKTCSKECGKKLRNKHRDHRISKEAIVDRDITLATLYQRDKGICYICGCACDWNDIEKHWLNVIEKQSGDDTIQWLKPSDHLSYQMPEKPFEIYEEDFVKTMMDYEMFKQGIDVKEFNEQLLQQILYSSEVSENESTTQISLSK